MGENKFFELSPKKGLASVQQLITVGSWPESVSQHTWVFSLKYQPFVFDFKKVLERNRAGPKFYPVD